MTEGRYKRATKWDVRLRGRDDNLGRTSEQNANFGNGMDIDL